ncbi:hypothetical protein [Trujillonella endophytica]|uniref:Uncharacterized protein n=1 Tax=Trujillonella endophytica TaxID=673521 RepID=A0A1H8WHL2_9ACTN|nr:hypothetical protein [Trujillella endophytica]SEP27099.1 hypothetical protein SAMN05660991_04422 [Trujillella endophytica]
MTVDRGIPSPRHDPAHDPAAYPVAAWSAQTSMEERRELLEQLQVVDVHLQTAASLDSRADACGNAVLARLLHDRARQHRHSAARLRAALADRGPASCRPLRRR